MEKLIRQVVDGRDATTPHPLQARVHARVGYFVRVHASVRSPAALISRAANCSAKRIGTPTESHVVHHCGRGTPA